MVARISEQESEMELKQLKIDYLNFMKQSLRWSDENTISVLYTLLLEQDYLTQDQIMELTGLSRAAVSETLKSLIETTNLPILQTRKPELKKNYYYAPFTFDHYIKHYLQLSMQATSSNLDILPKFLHRLQSIKTESIEKKHFENYLRINLLVTYHYSKLANDIDSVWDGYLSDPNYMLTLANEHMKSEIDFEDFIRETLKKSRTNENDSLYKIKQDFVKYAMESQSVYVRSRELSAISHALMIEPIPVTQDYLIEFTNYGRSTVSEVLTKLVKLDTVEIVKKTKDRKKYYKLKYSLYDYITIRSKASTKTIDKIILMLQENFNKRILTLNVDTKTKKKYSEFFLLNIKSFKIFSEIIDKYFTVIYDKLSIYK